MSTDSPFPIEAQLDPLGRALAKSPRVLLVAPPGAGKTTLVPQSLLNAKWLAGKKIVMLAPRRLAARAAAARIADLLGENVGETVGYRVRMDSRISDSTRIEVVTEGILTRQLQRDPGLEDTGLVIFDEFHERNLDGDLALAFCLDLQGVLNPELRILVMSATLDVAPLSSLLKDPPVIRCEGRQFPVETSYLGTQMPTGDIGTICGAIHRAVNSNHGSILVFLPGAGEIRRVAERLDQQHPGPEWDIIPLYGKLSKAVQDRAIVPSQKGKNKIVLATNIAETSLTIEGIGVVVDSGLERCLVHDPGASMSRLVCRPISKSSAHQRKGRAGRTGPGLCIRLWSKDYHRSLTQSRIPEIMEADLASFALETGIWGASDPEELRWLDPPPEASFGRAQSLLKDLAGLDSRGRITDHGKELALLPLHPRLAHMVLAANTTGNMQSACDLAAILSERDPLSFLRGAEQSDLQLRLDLLQAMRAGTSWQWYQARIHTSTARRVLQVSDDIRRRIVGTKRRERTMLSAGDLLALAYPDRIAQQRQQHSPGKSGQYLLASGRGCFLNQGDLLAQHPYLVVAELDGNRTSSRIYSAAAYSEKKLVSLYPGNIIEQQHLFWDEERMMTSACENRAYKHLTLSSRPIGLPEDNMVTEVLLEALTHHGIEVLPWEKKLLQLRARLTFLRAMDVEQWPDMSETTLLQELDNWLGPFLGGMRGFRDFSRLDLRAALMSRVPYQNHRLIDELAPTHLSVPSGSRVPIDYTSIPPFLAVRVQQMFGTSKHPTLYGGRQPLLLHLLSPAGRILQITSDLPGFWAEGWCEVQKEMKGRYPKHSWPDDPAQAKPTNRAKPRSRSS